MQKSLDAKLARIAADPSCGDFILADAKDADMAFGIAAPGRVNANPSHPEAQSREFRSMDEFRDQIREIVRQQFVDIMLMSVSTSNVMTSRENLFEGSAITPAIRANDTTDIWLAGQPGCYGSEPSMPFRTALLEDAQPVDLGLYSVTFNNDTKLDHATLSAYRDFRHEACQVGFRHFLEVFVPNAPVNPVENVPRFVNDHIARTLAAVGTRTRPLFLKMPYFGPAALEQLVSYDSSLVVGVLGGSSGTTFDAFNLLWEAKKYGARAALFGRKINNAEHQLSFVAQLRALADGHTEPAEAVKAYHGQLEKLKIRPQRTLAEDLKPQFGKVSYG